MHILESKTTQIMSGVVLPKLLLSACLFVSQTLLLLTLGTEAYGELMRAYLAISVGLSFANFTLHSTYEKFYSTSIGNRNIVLFKKLRVLSIISNCILGFIVYSVYALYFNTALYSIEALVLGVYFIIYNMQYIYLVVARYEEQQTYFYWSNLIFTIMSQTALVIYCYLYKENFNVFHGVFFAVLPFVVWIVVIDQKLVPLLVNKKAVDFLDRRIVIYTGKNFVNAAYSGFANNIDKVIISGISNLSVFGLYSYLSRCFVLIPILSSAIKSQAIPKLYKSNNSLFTSVWFRYVVTTQVALFLGGLCTVFFIYILIYVLPNQGMRDEITAGVLAFIWIFALERNVGNLQFFGPERDGNQHYLALSRFLLLGVNIIFLNDIVRSNFSAFEILSWIIVNNIFILLALFIVKSMRSGSHIVLSCLNNVFISVLILWGSFVLI